MTGITKYFGDEVKEVAATYTERINAAIDWAGGYYAFDTNAFGWVAPSLILGDATSRLARVAVLHDSYGVGTGDSDAGNSKFAGWPQKLLGVNYPWYFFGCSGWTLNGLMTTAGDLTRFLALLDLGGFTHVILQLCTNDLTTKTSAQFMAQVASLKTSLEALPLKPRLILTTPPPRTNSGNTAVSADYAQRELLDAAVRAGNGVGYGYIDQAVLFAGGDITVSGLWSTASSKGTADGIHPNKAGHDAVVTANSGGRSSLLSIAQYA
jgi:lysophospholipase L1-like esterase